MPRCLVALGSNLGDRQGTMARAVELLRAHRAVSSLAASGLRETAPIGGPIGQGPFLNAAVAFDTSLSPEQLHAALREIEAALGRHRGGRWAARTLDLDLLLYNDAVIDSPELAVPHPRMAFRRFVLEPAAEVAAGMTHPVIGWSVARLLAHLDTALPYVALLGLPGRGKTRLAERLVESLGGRLVPDPAAPAVVGQCDTPGPTAGSPLYRRQIEYVECRAHVLDRRHWPEGNVLAVSDFYFDQCLAYARLALGPLESEAFCGAFLAARAEVVLPKLLVVLDTPRSVRPASQPSDSASAPQVRRSLEGPQRDALASELSGLALRRDVGPVLYAGDAGLEARVAEVSAAIRSMQ
jgi:2-amino-4-hydroxy-6-hydroxymethyldihydropteridine diphosphokinase